MKLLLIAALFLPLAAGAAECKGADPCKACKDCSACRYCSPKNPRGGSCGVCRDQNGAQAAARDKKRAK